MQSDLVDYRPDLDLTRLAVCMEGMWPLERMATPCWSSRRQQAVADPSLPNCHPADEIDAIGTKRYDAHSGGEREIQRTMLELLNQLDGFDSMSEVKVRGTAGPPALRAGEGREMRQSFSARRIRTS